MKLEVGMYVRTKDGDVFILDRIEDNCLIPRYVYIPYIIVEEDVKKTSYNIIDLIEVGDYVNGCEVKEIMYRETDNTYWLDLERDSDFMFCAEDDSIESIVTKEKFKSMQYKVD